MCCGEIYSQTRCFIPEKMRTCLISAFLISIFIFTRTTDAQNRSSRRHSGNLQSIHPVSSFTKGGRPFQIVKLEDGRQVLVFVESNGRRRIVQTLSSQAIPRQSTLRQSISRDSSILQTLSEQKKKVLSNLKSQLQRILRRKIKPSRYTLIKRKNGTPSLARRRNRKQKPLTRNDIINIIKLIDGHLSGRVRKESRTTASIRHTVRPIAVSGTQIPIQRKAKRENLMEQLRQEEQNLLSLIQTTASPSTQNASRYELLQKLKDEEKRILTELAKLEQVSLSPLFSSTTSPPSPRDLIMDKIRREKNEIKEKLHHIEMKRRQQLQMQRNKASRARNIGLHADASRKELVRLDMEERSLLLRLQSLQEEDRAWSRARMQKSRDQVQRLHDQQRNQFLQMQNLGAGQNVQLQNNNFSNNRKAQDPRLGNILLSLENLLTLEEKNVFINVLSDVEHRIPHSLDISKIKHIMLKLKYSMKIEDYDILEKTLSAKNVFTTNNQNLSTNKNIGNDVTTRESNLDTMTSIIQNHLLPHEKTVILKRLSTTGNSVPISPEIQGILKKLQNVMTFADYRQLESLLNGAKSNSVSPSQGELNIVPGGHSTHQGQLHSSSISDVTQLPVNTHFNPMPLNILQQQAQLQIQHHNAIKPAAHLLSNIPVNQNINTNLHGSVMPQSNPFLVSNVNQISPFAMNNGLGMLKSPFGMSSAFMQELMFGDTTDPPDIPDPKAGNGSQSGIEAEDLPTTTSAPQTEKQIKAKESNTSSLPEQINTIIQLVKKSSLPQNTKFEFPLRKSNMVANQAGPSVMSTKSKSKLRNPKPGKGSQMPEVLYKGSKASPGNVVIVNDQSSHVFIPQTKERRKKPKPVRIQVYDSQLKNVPVLQTIRKFSGHSNNVETFKTPDQQKKTQGQQTLISVMERKVGRFPGTVVKGNENSKAVKKPTSAIKSSIPQGNMLRTPPQSRPLHELEKLHEIQFKIPLEEMNQRDNIKKTESPKRNIFVKDNNQQSLHRRSPNHNENINRPEIYDKGRSFKSAVSLSLNEEDKNQIGPIQSYLKNSKRHDSDGKLPIPNVPLSLIRPDDYEFPLKPKLLNMNNNNKTSTLPHVNNQGTPLNMNHINRNNEIRNLHTANKFPVASPTFYQKTIPKTLVDSNLHHANNKGGVQTGEIINYVKSPTHTLPYVNNQRSLLNPNIPNVHNNKQTPKLGPSNNIPALSPSLPLPDTGTHVNQNTNLNINTPPQNLDLNRGSQFSVSVVAGTNRNTEHMGKETIHVQPNNPSVPEPLIRKVSLKDNSFNPIPENHSFQTFAEPLNNNGNRILREAPGDESNSNNGYTVIKNNNAPLLKGPLQINTAENRQKPASNRNELKNNDHVLSNNLQKNDAASLENSTHNKKVSFWDKLTKQIQESRDKIIQINLPSGVFGPSTTRTQPVVFTTPKIEPVQLEDRTTTAAPPPKQPDLRMEIHTDKHGVKKITVIPNELNKVPNAPLETKEMCSPKSENFYCHGVDVFQSVRSIGAWCLAKCLQGACVETVCNCSCKSKEKSGLDHSFGEKIASIISGKSIEKNSAQVKNTLSDIYSSLQQTNQNAEQGKQNENSQTGKNSMDMHSLLSSIEKIIDNKLRKITSTPNPHGEEIEAEDLTPTTNPPQNNQNNGQSTNRNANDNWGNSNGNQNNGNNWNNNNNGNTNNNGPYNNGNGKWNSNNNEPWNNGNGNWNNNNNGNWNNNNNGNWNTGPNNSGWNNSPGGWGPGPNNSPSNWNQGPNSAGWTGPPNGWNQGPNWNRGGWNGPNNGWNGGGPSPWSNNWGPGGGGPPGHWNMGFNRRNPWHGGSEGGEAAD